MCRLPAALFSRQANPAPQELWRTARLPIGGAFHRDATRREAGVNFAPLLVMGALRNVNTNALTDRETISRSAAGTFPIRAAAGLVKLFLTDRR
jgi:hypothetical protein